MSREIKHGDDYKILDLRLYIKSDRHTVSILEEVAEALDVQIGEQDHHFMECVVAMRSSSQSYERRLVK